MARLRGARVDAEIPPGHLFQSGRLRVVFLKNGVTEHAEIEILFHLAVQEVHSVLSDEVYVDKICRGNYVVHH